MGHDEHPGIEWAERSSLPGGYLAARLLTVGLTYYIAARLGLLIPYVGSHVSLVWLPTGIATAAYWRWGRLMGLSVFVAAFTVNYQIGGPIWMGMGIALGNTLGPSLATSLLTRWAFDASLTSSRDLAVYLAAVMLGMVVTATNGTAWLSVAGLLPGSQWAAAWMTWWTGDAVGALLGGIPLIALTRTAVNETFTGPRGRLNTALLGVVLTCGLIGFSPWTAPSSALFFPLLSLPLLVTAVLALRAGVLAASLAVLLLSATAAWGTANGIGPFAGHDTHAGLLALWSYITAQACTSVLICGLAAQLLATSRQQKALFQRASEAILVVAPDGTVGDLNPAARSMLGLASDAFRGKRLSELPHGNGRTVAAWLDTGVLPGSTEQHQYLRLARVDETALEVEAQIARHHDARGHLQTQVMLRDVTERREAEARIAASEKRLRDIADNVPALIGEHDVETRYQFANRAYKDWFGVDQASLLGKTIAQGVSDEALAEVRPHVEAALRGETVSYERLSKIGRRLQVWVVPRRDETGVVSGFYTLGSDITARVQAEEALRQSEERYRAVLEDQDEVVVRFDAEGNVTYANTACHRLVGLPPEQFALAHWKSVVIAEDLPAVYERLKTLSPANPVVVTENRVKHAERGVRWMEFVNRVFYDADGKAREQQIVGRDITRRKELKQQLAATNALVQDLYDNAPCGYHSLDRQGKYLHINAVELAWLGCSMDEAIGKLGTQDFLTEEGKELYRQSFPKFLEQGHIEGLEYDLVSRDGTVRRVSLAATSVRDSSGAIVMSRSVLYDITETHRIRLRLQQLSREQESMLNTDLVGITKVKDRHFAWKNDAFERILGYGPDELLGAPSRLVYSDDAAYKAFGREAYAAMNAGCTYRTQMTLVRKNGSLIWIDMSGAPLDGGESVWMLQDISLLKQEQERVEHIAFHDALTGLANRVLLGDRIGQMIGLSQRLNNMFVVCFIDLDGFKTVNDTFGHDAGDELLKVVSRRLLACIRANDTVARLGGDEFIVLLSTLETKDECQPILQRIAAELSEPVSLAGGHECRVSASLGVAFYPEDATSADTLLTRADEAMYAAKRARRDRGRLA